MRHQPAAQGLYDPRHEHDACGVAFVATLTGVASHDIVDQGLTALRNLEHRGASGAEPDSGDGAGILLADPRRVPARGRRLRAAAQRGATPSASPSSPPTTTQPRRPRSPRSASSPPRRA